MLNSLSLIDIKVKQITDNSKADDYKQLLSQAT